MKDKFQPLAVALFLLSGCSAHKPVGAVMEDEFRAAISSDAQTIVYADLAQLKASALYRRHADLLVSSRLDSLAQRTGLDPRKDISQMCAVWDGKALLLLARASFDAAKLQQDLIGNGGERVAANGHTLIVHGSDAVTFLPRGLVVAGQRPAVEAELVRLSANAGRIPEELQQRMGEVAADAQFWVVSRGGLPAADMQLRADLDSALSNFATAVSGTSGGVRFDTGLHALGRIVCKSPEGAQRVNDAFRGLIGLARLSTKDNELDLLRMWDAVSISKDRQLVKVQADLPADLADKLIDKASALRGQGRAQ